MKGVSIPKYHELYYPILNTLRDGAERTSDQIKVQVAVLLNLSDWDLTKRSSTGTRPLFDYRLVRACSDLKKTGFIETVGKGIFKITEAGNMAMREAKSNDSNEWRVIVAYNEFQRLGKELEKLMQE